MFGCPKIGSSKLGVSVVKSIEMRHGTILSLLTVGFILLATSHLPLVLNDDTAMEINPTSGRHDHCEDDYEDDQAGCESDSQCQWELDDD